MTRLSPRPWTVDATDPAMLAIRDRDGEVVVAGSPGYPLGRDDADAIVRAVGLVYPAHGGRP